jgi:hypothetical protein
MLTHHLELRHVYAVSKRYCIVAMLIYLELYTYMRNIY